MMINIILIKNFNFLGKEGDEINVKYGYAINYLIPNKIAVIASKYNIDKIKLKNIKINKIKENNIEIFNEFKNKINKLKELNFYVKSDKNGKLFGSIKSINISKLIKKIFYINIDKKYIIIPNKSIQKLGIYKINIKKYNKIINLNINVNNEIINN